MKILMYGWEFPPRISGGLGVACHAMVQELAKKKVDVTMVLPYAMEQVTSRENVSFIGCDAVVASLTRQSDISDLGQACFGENLVRFLHPYFQSGEEQYLEQLDEASARVASIIAKLQAVHQFADFHGVVTAHAGKSLPFKLTGQYGMNLLAEVCHYAIVAGALAVTVPHDVIHAHDWLTVLAGVEAKKRSSKPLLFHVHALEPDRSGVMVDARIFAIEKYGMEQADKIIAVSEYTKSVIVCHYGISPEKIIVVHNGSYVDDNSTELPQPRRHKMVLFLGRLAHQKGPFFFIEAAQKILEKRRDVHFVVAGTGGLLREMIDRVAALRIGKQVHFTGFLDKKKVERIFRLADVYVMPSVSEPFGLSCLEALSYGVPVVISKQSGVAEVLSHVVKVDFWNTDDMANKILALLDYKALRQITLQQSIDDLECLTWAKTADKLICLYSSFV